MVVSSSHSGGTMVVFTSMEFFVLYHSLITTQTLASWQQALCLPIMWLGL